MDYSDRRGAEVDGLRSRWTTLCVSRGRASITSTSCRLRQLSHKLTLGPRLVVSSVLCVGGHRASCSVDPVNSKHIRLRCRLSVEKHK